MTHAENLIPNKPIERELTESNGASNPAGVEAAEAMPTAGAGGIPRTVIEAFGIAAIIFSVTFGGSPPADAAGKAETPVSTTDVIPSTPDAPPLSPSPEPSATAVPEATAGPEDQSCWVVVTVTENGSDIDGDGEVDNDPVDSGIQVCIEFAEQAACATNSFGGSYAIPISYDVRGRDVAISVRFPDGTEELFPAPRTGYVGVNVCKIDYRVDLFGTPTPTETPTPTYTVTIETATPTATVTSTMTRKETPTPTGTVITTETVTTTATPTSTGTVITTETVTTTATPTGTKVKRTVTTTVTPTLEIGTPPAEITPGAADEIEMDAADFAAAVNGEGEDSQNGWSIAEKLRESIEIVQDEARKWRRGGNGTRPEQNIPAVSAEDGENNGKMEFAAAVYSFITGGRDGDESGPSPERKLEAFVEGYKNTAELVFTKLLALYDALSEKWGPDDPRLESLLKVGESFCRQSMSDMPTEGRKKVERLLSEEGRTKCALRLVRRELEPGTRIKRRRRKLRKQRRRRG